MENKIILISGASRGIGAAIAKGAAQQGYDVCISYLHDQQAAQAVVNFIESKTTRAIMVQADVAIEQDVINLFTCIDQQLGSITALVNNAGVLDQQMPLVQMTAQRIERIFSVNVLGSFICAREAVKRMSTHYGGAGGGIVNISSLAARLGSPGEYIDYAASKGAIDTMTIGLAKEVGAQGIRVNAVRPGAIYTDIHSIGGESDRVDRIALKTPMQRGGYADEVANTVLWLLSDQASYISGAIVDVAGAS